MDITEPLKFEQQFEQQTRIMKLSQAIREGAKLRPQCRKVLFDGYGTCALGAAAEARGWKPQVFERRPAREFLSDVCQPGINYLSEFGIMIGGWNDAGMTREAIADKLGKMGL